MINLILIFPIIACIVLFLTKKQILNDIMTITYAILHFIASLTYCINIDLIPMWGTTKFFAVDDTNKIFLLALSAVFLAVSVYNSGYMKNENSSPKHKRHYTYMMLLFVMAMTGSVLSTNLGSAWVFIEATTLTSAYLIYFNKTKHSLEAAWKYVFICSIGIALAFVGIILLTVATGSADSLFYPDLYKTAVTFNPFWLKLAFVFLLFGIGTKMGIAPMHFWLPDAHSEAPSPVSALLSAALLNSAFLMIINVFKITVIAGCDAYARSLLAVTGFLSLFIAAIFVYHINNYKRMLAYSSVENMGILAIGTALGGAGMLAAVIHLVGHSLIKSSFFMTSGNILQLYGTKEIKPVSGLLKTDKKTGMLWICSFLALAAFPPSVLFISEFLIIRTMIEQLKYFEAFGFFLLLTVILYGVAKAVIYMIFAENTGEFPKKKLSWRMYLPQTVLLTVAFVIGIFMPVTVTNMFLASVAGF